MKSILLSRAINLHKVLLFISGLLFTAAMLYAGSAAAAAVGTIVDLSGPGQLLVQKSDGAAKILSQSSTVEKGDVLQTKQDTYARIHFIDDSEITLGPNTKFRIDEYSFKQDNAKEDRSVYTLIAGTLRSITGALGKRNKDRYELKTPAATIGIRGTTYIADYLPAEDPISCETVGWTESTKDVDQAMNKDKAQQSTPNKQLEKKRKKERKEECAGREPGLYVAVEVGEIAVENDAGAQNYTIGQYGYASAIDEKPILLTENPGIVFNPPFGNRNTIECKV